jgi:hypothetical protein
MNEYKRMISALALICGLLFGGFLATAFPAPDYDYRVLIERVKLCHPSEKNLVRYNESCESGWTIGPYGRMTLKTGRVWNVPARCLIEKEIIEIFMVCPMRFELP